MQHQNRGLIGATSKEIAQIKADQMEREVPCKEMAPMMKFNVAQGKLAPAGRRARWALVTTVTLGSTMAPMGATLPIHGPSGPRGRPDVRRKADLDPRHGVLCREPFEYAAAY